MYQLLSLLPADISCLNIPQNRRNRHSWKEIPVMINLCYGLFSIIAYFLSDMKIPGMTL